MKILRKQTMNVNANELGIGDQITVDLNTLGIFTATVCDITSSGAMCVFDQCVAQRKMNEFRTNKGGYEASDLYNWINNDLLNSFPEELRSSVKEISLPTYGQIFGHDDWYHSAIEPDEDNQFECMKIRQNRKADFNNETEWYWLRNATKEEYSTAAFVFVASDGNATYNTASYTLGVRPVFCIG